MGTDDCWRARKIFGVVVVTLAAMLVYSYYRGGLGPSPNPKPPQLPSSAEVTTMIVAIKDLGVGETGEFRIPGNYHSEILSTLAPVCVDTANDPWDQIGSVELKCKDGRTILIHVYDGGVNRLHFSINGVRCFRGGEYLRIEGGNFLDEARAFLGALKVFALNSTNPEMQNQFSLRINLLRESARKNRKPP
jgi:hypothetical protein